MQSKTPKHIPVVFHNLANYDANLFIMNLGVTSGKIDCIANNEEKYITFKTVIIVDTFTNNDGKSCNVKRTRLDSLIVSNLWHHHLIDSLVILKENSSKIWNNSMKEKS